MDDLICRKLQTLVSVSVPLFFFNFHESGLFEARWTLSDCDYLTRVRSLSLSPAIQLQEVPVAGSAAEPGFSKMNGAGQKVHVRLGRRAALFWNVDVSSPAASSGCTPGKRAALLPDEPAQTHRGGGVATGTSYHTFKTADAGCKHTNCQQTIVQGSQRWTSASSCVDKSA